VSGEEVELSFRVTEMNDLLKSLTALDWGGGKVLGIDYATPQSQEERLAGCSIRLDNDRSLRDLLVGPARAARDAGAGSGCTLTGKLLGLDELPERQPGRNVAGFAAVGRWRACADRDAGPRPGR
jgi:hypothetical protein